MKPDIENQIKPKSVKYNSTLFEFIILSGIIHTASFLITSLRWDYTIYAIIYYCFSFILMNIMSRTIINIIIVYVNSVGFCAQVRLVKPVDQPELPFWFYGAYGIIAILWGFTMYSEYKQEKV